VIVPASGRGAPVDDVGFEPGRAGDVGRFLDCCPDTVIAADKVTKKQHFRRTQKAILIILQERRFLDSGPR